MSRISQPLRIAIIGVTGRGGLSRHWHEPGGKSIVIAGADINEEYLREFKQKIGQSVSVTTDYRKLLESDDIDAIAVTSPDYCRNYTFIGTEGRIENLDDDSKVIVRTRDQAKRDIPFDHDH
jgi:hypothetical protein